MPKFNYVKQPRIGETVSWVEGELASIERAIWSIPTVLAGEEVSDTAYTLVKGDQDKVKKTTSGSPTTITVPTHANAGFELGAMVHFYQEGAGQVTLVGAGTVTVNSRPGLKSAGQYAMFSVWKEADNVWVAFGDLTT